MNIKKIEAQFFNFMDGTRVLMLMHRKKEGGIDRNRHCIKRISRDRDEFIKILEEFKLLIESSKKPYRIYSTVNKRSLSKAVDIFKHNQVDADSTKDTNFYIDSKNRFISALMQPGSRDEKNFLIDIDTKEKCDIEKIEKILDTTIGRNSFKYETKNGYHYITPPFDVRAISDYEYNKDGLMLLYYVKT